VQISRVKRSNNISRKAYDRLSRVYDLLSGTSETRYIHLGLELLAVTAGETVLEIGPGTGKALLKLCAQSGGPGRVYGIDLSPGMLQVTHWRLAKAGLESRAHLLIGDGVALPYSNNSFSAIFLSFTLELFDTPEIPLVLAECQRVLHPRGRLGVVAMQMSEHPGWIDRLYAWFHKHLPTYVDCRPIDATRMIQAAGFYMEKRQAGSIWGLPVQVVLAQK
jgi:ubiquinone/menaquinone biosynthesis C-methylase UbiE